MIGKKELVMVLDSERKKCSVNGGPWVYFKGCTSRAKFNEVVEAQKKKDKERDPGPDPSDRDGYWVCDGTWWWCTTRPPYVCVDSGVPC